MTGNVLLLRLLQVFPILLLHILNLVAFMFLEGLTCIGNWPYRTIAETCIIMYRSKILIQEMISGFLDPQQPHGQKSHLNLSSS